MPQASCSLSGSVASTSAATESWAAVPALAVTTIRITGIRIWKPDSFAVSPRSLGAGRGRLQPGRDGASPSVSGLLHPHLRQSLDRDHRAAHLAEHAERGRVLFEKQLRQTTIVR